MSFLFLLLITTLTGCYRNLERKYYSDRDNFFSDEAIVDNIILHKDGSIYLWLSEIDPIYQDNTFVIRNDNARLVMENDFLGKVKVGDVVTYISAPAYFGDGYCMPIVAISVSGNVILQFEDGYSNLMKMY